MNVPYQNPNVVGPDEDVDTSRGVTNANEGGLLDLFAHTREEARKPYQRRNLVATGYTQLVRGRSSLTKRPLATVKDFISQWVGGSLSPVDFLGEGSKAIALTHRQQRALKLFIQAARQWTPVIEANLARPMKSATRKTEPEDFYFKDMMQFLMQTVDRKGELVLTLEENIRTAMVFSAFSWVHESAYRDIYNSDDAINFALGRENKTNVTNQLRSLMAPIGIRQNVVFNSLGQRVLAALGLEPKSDIPLCETARLESALGAHVVKLLIDEAILVRTPVSGKFMAHRTDDPNTSREATHYFLKLCRDEDGQLSPKASRIHELLKGTQNIIDELFQVEHAVKEPSLKPIPFEQVLSKNSNQRVPNNLSKILSGKNKESYFVREDLWTLMAQMDKSLALGIVGIDPVDEFTHRLNIFENKVRNDSHVCEYKCLTDFVNYTLLPSANGLGQHFYFEHEVWKQQGVGLATNLINPQTSKIQRFMLSRREWETTIQMSNSSQMENFKLRVIEGLRGKAKKLCNAELLTKYSYIFNTAKASGEAEKHCAEIFEKAITALLVVINGESLTLQQQSDVSMGVKVGGEKLQSLDALMAIAHYRAAKSVGFTEFTTNMLREIDGVANGPMLGYILLGAGSTADEMLSLLVRVGFRKVGDVDEQLSHEGDSLQSQDLYEITIDNALRRARSIARLNRKIIPLFEAVFFFVGDLAEKGGKINKTGRELIKTPLISFIFGSSLVKSVEFMADEFVETIYRTFEAIARGHKDNAQLISQLNILIGEDAEHWSQNLTNKDVLENALTNHQVAAVKKSFHKSLGRAISETLEDYFAIYIERRNQFIKTSNLAYQLYDAVLQGLRENCLEVLVKNGEISHRLSNTGELVPVSDLSPVHEAALRTQMYRASPILHTLMSLESGTLEAGLEIAKSTRKLSQNRQFQSEVLLGNNFDGKPIRTLINGYERVVTKPGVAMFPLAIQSTESAISHYAASQGNVLTVHDAHWTGLVNFIQTTRNLNQSTWHGILNYSPASEMYAALARTICGLVSILEEHEVPQSVRHVLNEALSKEMHERDSDSLGDYFQSSLRDAKHAAFMADKLKLETLIHLQSVNMYAIEGGSFNVTEMDRQNAQSKLNMITREVSEVHLDNAVRLGELLQCS